MTREEAIMWIKTLQEDAIFEVNDALLLAIKALSKPNYETDNEVRLAVTDRNKDKVVLWDAFGEAEYYPHGEINCVHCPHYHETEDDTGVHGHCGSHGIMTKEQALKWLKQCAENDCYNCDNADKPEIWCDKKMKECVRIVEDVFNHLCKCKCDLNYWYNSK